MAARKKSSDDPLRVYREKRRLDRTPEPAGSVSTVAGRRFVVHEHKARRHHWDLRLEMEGVLRSWAVPKGPSRDPSEKRLAVLVEDHPVEYGDFEGVIPAGGYGAGPTIIWDRGVWVPLEDPLAGLESGKLLFELKGHKLRGIWTLVRLRDTERDWLLIKERDAFASPTDDFWPGSVVTGRTIEELLEGRDRAAEVLAELERLDAPRRRGSESFEPMLAESRPHPFTRDGWLFELKYDGWRLIAARDDDAGGSGDGDHDDAGASVRLFLRSGREATATFPEIAQALAALPYGRLVVDGEVVVLDDSGRPNFQRLQKRALLTRAADVRRAAEEHPAILYVFDLLAFDDYDVRPLPLVERKALLARLIPALGTLRYSDHIAREGEALYENVMRLGLEGVVAKKADSPYRAGRSPHWLKIRADRTADFAVVGYAKPKGSRAGFGALHLATCDDGVFTYAGRAGTGFRDRHLRELRAALDQAVRPDPPCTGAPTGAEHVWVEPRMVVEVRYRERTDDGLLRHPVFVRLRPDKAPTQCARQEDLGPVAADPALEDEPAAWSKPEGDAVRQEEAGAPGADYAAEPEAVVVEEPEAEDEPSVDVAFSNTDKVFWPEEGYTKGDLLAYYRAIAPWLLEYLRDRPLVMTRFPDGIHGKSFFQKDAPGFAPAWLRTVSVWSEDSQRELNYFVADDVASLLYVINLGTIPLHVWASRVETLDRPDWSILDLDPKGAPFTDVVQVALVLRSVCDDIGLPCFPKTSGSTGLHVLIPLGGQCTFEQARLLAELLARVVVREVPEIATLTRVIQRREGKVYLDYLQNGQGKLLVAPFSARPVPGARVSTPLEWREVTARLDPARFTIASVPKRMVRLGRDPMRPLLDTRPDLIGALQRLRERMG